MNDDEFTLSLSTFKFLVLNLHNLTLWLPAFVLAIVLRLITHKFHHQLIFPLCEYFRSPFRELCANAGADVGDVQILLLFLLCSTSL